MVSINICKYALYLGYIDLTGRRISPVIFIIAPEIFENGGDVIIKLRFAKEKINNEKGASLSIVMFGMFIIILIIGITFMFGQAFGGRKIATETWNITGEALDFAIDATSQMGIYKEQQLNAPLARRYFDAAFAQMTNTTVQGNSFVPNLGSPYKGPIIVEEFRAIHKGDSVPGGSAGQPGYLVTLNVSVFGGKVPYIGYQTINVRMRQFSVVSMESLN